MTTETTTTDLLVRTEEQRYAVLDEILTTKEVAAILGVHWTHVTRKARLLRSKGVRCGRSLGRTGHFFLPEDIENIGEDLRKNGPG